MCEPSVYCLISSGMARQRTKVRYFREALRHICVTAERKLRAIENCIFSIRSIERNMRSILRTVHPAPKFRSLSLA
jgi:hypothetical protein